MPKFTPEEQFLVEFMRANKVAQLNVHMLGAIAGGLLMVGFATYYANPWMSLCAFVVMSGFWVYEDRTQSRYHPVLHSIILKYEQAIQEAGSDPGTNQISN